VHPVYNVQDWDAPEGAIEWPRLIKFLHDVKETGDIPADHYSHDHLNEQREVALDKAIVEKYRKEFTRIQEESKSRNEQIKWGLVDGFLLYWHPEVVALLDACIFLRVPYDVLKKRRDDRSGYHTAGEQYLFATVPNILTWPVPSLPPPLLRDLLRCLFLSGSRIRSRGNILA